MKKAIAITVLILTILCSFVFAIPAFAETEDGTGEAAVSVDGENADGIGGNRVEVNAEQDEQRQNGPEKISKKSIAKKTLTGSFFTSSNIALTGGCVAVACAVIYFVCKKKKAQKSNETGESGKKNKRE